MGETATVYFNGTDYVKSATTTSGSGTVTSVAASVPAFLSIAGSPITTSGTLAVTLSGTALPVANGGTGQTTYTNGQLLIGNTTGNTLTKATLTQGTGVTITNSTGSITLAIGQAVATSSDVQFNSLGVGTAGSATAGEIRATNNVTAYYSDDRLKTRLGVIENALDKVRTLDSFYYEANETAQELGYTPVREVGISAQQVQAIMPEVVAPAPIDDRYLTVRYERLVPLLLAAIKELEAKVQALESK